MQSLTIENEKQRELIRKSFVKKHGAGKWYRINRYLFALNLGEREIGRLLQLPRNTTQYWVKKIRKWAT